MTTPTLRAAARVIALDDDGRVLLLRYDENGGFWATPGGSLDPGEDHTTALRRELGEELGIRPDIELGALLAERSSDHNVGGQPRRQVERYYLAQLNPGDVDPARATQPDNIRGRRWWTADELRTTSETVYPLALADLITGVLADGVPEQPVVLN